MGIHLHESENAWKPSFKCETSTDEGEKLKKFIQGVMNKLTFQKFKILLSKLKEIEMDTEEKLRLFIDLIFENAINEPRYCIMYANLCKYLENIKIQVEGPEKELGFLNLMIMKCNNELLQENFNEIKRGLAETYISGSNNLNHNAKAQYQNEYRKIKIRYYGALRFFGEICNLNAFFTNNVHQYLNLYLNQNTEESLEFFCVLMKTTGKGLEEHCLSESTKESKVNVYFQILKNIIHECSLCSRIKFMLMDLIDLKENNWTPRRNENIPKTIDEIREEAERDFNELPEKQKILMMKKKFKSKKKKKINLDRFTIHDEEGSSLCALHDSNAWTRSSE